MNMSGMFQLLLYSKGEWFSTIWIPGWTGFTTNNIQRVRSAITKSENYWKSPITWELRFDGYSVTQEFLKQESEIQNVLTTSL